MLFLEFSEILDNLKAAVIDNYVMELLQAFYTTLLLWTIKNGPVILHYFLIRTINKDASTVETNAGEKMD